jgi:hypothetical protein
MRVKDEVAGKKIRCPACGAALTVPQGHKHVDGEEEAVNLLLEASAEPTPSANNDTSDNTALADSIRSPARPTAKESPEWKWLEKKPRPMRKRRTNFLGKVFNNVNPNYGVMWTGIMITLGGVALGIVCALIVVVSNYWIGRFTARIIAVAIILFFIGLGTFFKGLMGRSD